MPVSLLAWPGAIAIGVSLGLLGSGGSIITVPVLLGGVTIHRAVATSLVIIALKSFSGFYKYVDVLDAQNLQLDWPTLFRVTGLSIAGSFLGARIASKIPQQRLKQGFGYFLIVMGLYILVRTAPDVLQVFTAG